MKQMLVVLTVVLCSGCSIFPTQEARFTGESIQIDGGRMFRDYEATVTRPDGTIQTFSSKVYTPIPERLIDTVEINQ